MRKTEPPAGPMLMAAFPSLATVLVLALWIGGAVSPMVAAVLLLTNCLLSGCAAVLLVKRQQREPGDTKPVEQARQ